MELGAGHSGEWVIFDLISVIFSRFGGRWILFGPCSLNIAIVIPATCFWDSWLGFCVFQATRQGHLCNHDCSKPEHFKDGLLSQTCVETTIAPEGCAVC